MSTDATDRPHRAREEKGSTAGDPLVSVVIPTFNRSDLLPDAIDSVVDQTYRNWELIIVDDGSTDDTEQVVNSYSDSRVRYTENTGSKGPGGARNTGVRKAKGGYIAFLDSDDVWTSGKLRAQVDCMEANPRTGLVAGRCIYVDDELEPTGYESPSPKEIPYEEICVSTSVPGSSSNVLVRRRAFEDAGGFDPELLRGEDRDLWIRISRHWKVYCVDEVTAKIRVHDEERQHRDLETVLECREAINRRIPEGSLRQKAQAWMWYNVGLRLMQGRLSDGARLRGLAYVFRSFVTYPLPVGENHKRLRPLLWEIRDVVEGKR